MIPMFPIFRNLTLSDRLEVEKFTKDFTQYSDHQFTSLWGWNLDNDIQVSVLRGNLVLIMRDYLTGKPCYSLCGLNELEETALDLLSHAKAENIQPILKFIPENMASTLKNCKKLQIKEDRDNFDYVFLLQDALDADDKKSRRKYLRSFKNRYHPDMRQLDMSITGNRNLVMDHAISWTMEKDANPTQLDSEIPAMKRLLNDLPDAVVVTGLFSNKELIGFSVEELLSKGHVTGHFQRIDYDYRRCFLYLNHVLNMQLLEKGFIHMNVQQDAGDLKLRDKKMSKYPYVSFEKKYEITATA